MTKNATTPGDALAYRTLLLGQSEDAGLRKGPRTQARIRWAACELLEGMSLDALTVQDIGRQAGIAQGTLYQYFGSRNELVAAVLHDFIAFLRERMLAAAAGSASFQESVTRSTRTYCELFRANRGLMKCLLHHFDTFPEARAILGAFNQEWIDLVVSAMRRQQRAARPTARDIRRRAYALGGMVDQYLAAIYLYEDRHVVATAGSIKEVVATLTAIWCRAFADILPAAEMGPAAR